MQFPPLQSATLLRRYKRFLADVRLDNNEEITLHCANTGKMTGCGEMNDKIWFSDSQSKTRKYPCSWELTELKNGEITCINTHRSNLLTVEALENKVIKELSEYDHIQTEVKYGEENSRIDILLTSDNLPDCYVEVKSITLVDNNKRIGMFPDAETVRGQKHLRELMLMREQGHRAVIFFCGLHSGFDCFTVAHHIDPTYAKLLKEAIQKGVEVYAYACEFKKENGVPVALNLTESVPCFDLS